MKVQRNINNFISKQLVGRDSASTKPRNLKYLSRYLKRHKGDQSYQS